MKFVRQKQFITRDSILKLLTDAEISSVSRAETSERLADGDEYVDLKNLDRGVRRAGRMLTPAGRVLPRKAVTGSTWLKIVEQLATLRRATQN